MDNNSLIIYLKSLWSHRNIYTTKHKLNVCLAQFSFTCSQKCWCCRNKSWNKNRLNSELIIPKVSYFFKLWKILWLYEHFAWPSLRSLKDLCENEGHWIFSFLSFTTGPIVPAELFRIQNNSPLIKEWTTASLKVCWV